MLLAKENTVWRSHCIKIKDVWLKKCLSKHKEESFGKILYVKIVTCISLKTREKKLSLCKGIKKEG